MRPAQAQLQGAGQPPHPHRGGARPGAVQGHQPPHPRRWSWGPCPHWGSGSWRAGGGVRGPEPDCGRGRSVSRSMPRPCGVGSFQQVKVWSWSVHSSVATPGDGYYFYICLLHARCRVGGCGAMSRLLLRSPDQLPILGSEVTSAGDMRVTGLSSVLASPHHQPQHTTAADKY